MVLGQPEFAERMLKLAETTLGRTKSQAFCGVVGMN
jgi:hypothetical protein